MPATNPSEASKLAVAALVCLAVAMNGAVLLVTDVLFDGTTVIVTVAGTATLYIGLWLVLGLVRRLGRERSH
jgi:high-affinity Fe2+/Pb2+ permease